MDGSNCDSIVSYVEVVGVDIFEDRVDVQFRLSLHRHSLEPRKHAVDGVAVSNGEWLHVLNDVVLISGGCGGVEQEGLL